MTDQIGVDFSRLEQTQLHLAQTQGQMNTKLSDLKSEIRPLVANWEGEASAQYQVLQAQWDSAAADLNAVLGRINVALAEANAQLQVAERTNAARF